MGNGSFLHNALDVAQISSLLTGNIKDYKDKIVELNQLIENISQSTAWKDMEVKTAFINTCKSYIIVYKAISSAMENYVNYLKGKSNSYSALENAYSRMG